MVWPKYISIFQAEQKGVLYLEKREGRGQQNNQMLM
jgi:hypothetical protein